MSSPSSARRTSSQSTSRLGFLLSAVEACAWARSTGLYLMGLTTRKSLSQAAQAGELIFGGADGEGRRTTLCDLPPEIWDLVAVEYCAMMFEDPAIVTQAAQDVVNSDDHLYHLSISPSSSPSSSTSPSSATPTAPPYAHPNSFAPTPATIPTLPPNTVAKGGPLSRVWLSVGEVDECVECVRGRLAIESLVDEYQEGFDRILRLFGCSLVSRTLQGYTYHGEVHDAWLLATTTLPSKPAAPSSAQLARFAHMTSLLDLTTTLKLSDSPPSALSRGSTLPLHQLDSTVPVAAIEFRSSSSCELSSSLTPNYTSPFSLACVTFFSLTSTTATFLRPISTILADFDKKPFDLTLARAHAWDAKSGEWNDDDASTQEEWGKVEEEGVEDEGDEEEGSEADEEGGGEEDAAEDAEVGED